MKVKVMFMDTSSGRRGLEPTELKRYSSKKSARRLIEKWVNAAKWRKQAVVYNINCCTICYDDGCFMLWIETEK